MQRLTVFMGRLALLVALLTARESAWSASPDVDFQRDIRPLLAENCFHCHGPDPEHREAELRLDVEDAALDAAIVRGQPEQSEVIARITSTDPDLRMPPADSGKSLTPDQVELLRRWVAAGAAYESHWAFTPPVRPPLPEVRHPEWGRNPIDAFVLARLEQEGLTPSAEAERPVWLRRLSLDLIGLPPAIDEVDAFVRDSQPLAHERQVQRLLKSPHFGERWGRLWLDAARYADSDGYEKDKPREMWFYRDWVVSAFNRDLPYDQFVIQQIAGDLLPHPSQDELVATGFLRNSMVNEEGGADPEQFRMEAMFDRMDAVGKAVLGLTIQCSQCHSHKYDPLTQAEYYRMFAFLNNTHDAIIPAYTTQEQHQRDDLLRQIATAESQLQQSLPDWPQRMAAWEAEQSSAVGDWQVLPLTDLPYEGTKYRRLEDDSVISESYAPVSSAPEFVAETTAEGITGLRLELLTHPQLPCGGPGRSLRGTAALSEMSVYVAPADDRSKRTKVKLVAASADVNPAERPQPEYLRNIKAADGDKRTVGPIAFAIDGDKNTAWTTDSDPGRRNQSREAVFVFEKPVGFPQGTVITLQPEMRHGGWNNNDNHNCLIGRFRFSITQAEQPAANPAPRRVQEILTIPAADRTPRQEAAVFGHWRTTVDEWAEANAAIETLWQQYPEGATQLVLEERRQPRETAILERGNFLSPTERVTPGVPSFLHSRSDGQEPPRLDFARWLVDRQSPTTARAIVNRLWQAYFGVGLVETSDDLGSQGSPPSHPELLDWLAVELMEHNWSLKHLHDLITTSATYRQASHVTPELQRRDPYNRLLARGPRVRVDAEIVRDVMLAASGLLNPTLGGASVYPPAPRFLFDPPASYGPKTWNEETGENRYRRGLYTFRFRSVPYPMLETFDAVPGNVGCVRRSRSNTPLQALTTLNEPLSMECAEALGRRAIEAGGRTDSSRLTFAWRCCVSRTPTAAELETLQGLLDRQRKRLATGELDASRIIADGAGEAEALQEQAAWTLVARAILNLDETITKE